MRSRRRGRLGVGCWLLGGLLGLVGGPAAAQTVTVTPAPASRSVLEPTYDVLLPDPEPQAESAKPGAAAEPERSSSDIDSAGRVLSAAK
mgnify:FL=1